jgi:SAM-dependent methyltransferase
MIRSLERRAARAGLSDRIETRSCPRDGLRLDDLEEKIDFALAFAVVHEVPDAPGLLAETRSVLVPGGRLLIVEPAGHVKKDAFATTVAAAEQAEFAVVERPQVKRNHAILLEKTGPGGS